MSIDVIKKVDSLDQILTKYKNKFIYFQITSDIDPENYNVYVINLNYKRGKYVLLSKLKPVVEIPNDYYIAENSYIYIYSNNCSNPFFVGRFGLGKVYFITLNEFLKYKNTYYIRSGILK